MTDLKNYKVPPMFRYCDFADTTMPDGTVLRTDGEPIALNDGNVIFPSGWTNAKTEAWRRDNKLEYPGQ